MLRRELQIALRARLTWVQAALSALLAGHSFVLALDLYSAGARSVEAGTLMAREFDPLLGVARPTLGGLYFAVSLLGPIAAARPIAVEKERGTWPSLLLFVGSVERACAAKWLASVVSVSLQLVAPIALLAVWCALGGHLHAGETATALLGHALYLMLVASLAVAASAWTRSLAQAATVALLVVAASWAIDASEGFAALAWMGRAVDWSVSTHLAPLERGVLPAGAVLWLAMASAAAFALALVGARFDLAPLRRVVLGAGVLVAALALLTASGRVRGGVDTTEAERASLPPAAVAGLRSIDSPIEVEVWLDRDDARRHQLESDFLSRLSLARPDARVRMPLDERAGAEAARDEDYGRIVLRAGGGERVTRSTSRKELTTLLFEAAGRTAPDAPGPEYPGYPLIVEGARRDAAAACAYLLFPGALLAAGFFITRSRRRGST